MNMSFLLKYSRVISQEAFSNSLIQQSHFKVKNKSITIILPLLKLRQTQSSFDSRGSTSPSSPGITLFVHSSLRCTVYHSEIILRMIYYSHQEHDRFYVLAMKKKIFPSYKRRSLGNIHTSMLFDALALSTLKS